MSRSGSKTYKGCAMCKPHKRYGQGIPDRTPVNVLRKLGKRRRLTRRYLGDDQ